MSLAVQSPLVLKESAAEYHAREAVSNSRREHFRRSPRLFEAYYVTKTAKPEPPSDKMDIGTGSHAWILEPDSFESSVALIPEECLSKNGTRTGTAYKQFAEENQGKALLKEDQWRWVKGIRRAVMNHPVASRLVDGAAQREVTIEWECEASGLQRKCRIDLDTSYNGHPLLADLKTTSDHTPEAFGRSIARYGYHRQGAFYFDAAEALYGPKAAFVYIAVASEPPHVVRVYHLRPQALEKGKRQVATDLLKIAKCYETGDWSEEGENEICWIDLPNWALNEED